MKNQQQRKNALHVRCDLFSIKCWWYSMWVSWERFEWLLCSDDEWWKWLCVHDMKFDVRIQLKNQSDIFNKRKDTKIILFCSAGDLYIQNVYINKSGDGTYWHRKQKNDVVFNETKQNIETKRQRNGNQRINEHNTNDIWCNKTVWGGF